MVGNTPTAVLVALTPLVPAGMEGLAAMRPAAAVALVDILGMVGLVVAMRLMEVTALGAGAVEEAAAAKAFIKTIMFNTNSKVEAGPEAMLACLALA